jgi:hypothetical protein
MGVNARHVADFLALVNHPCLRAIWDPGNEQGDAQASDAYPAGYETLKPWIVHVQLKDVKRLADGRVASVR